MEDFLKEFLCENSTNPKFASPCFKTLIYNLFNILNSEVKKHIKQIQIFEKFAQLCNFLFFFLYTLS